MLAMKLILQKIRSKLHNYAGTFISFLVKLLGKSILYFYAPLYSIVWCFYVSDDFVQFFSLGNNTRIVLVGIVVYLSLNVFGNMIIAHVTHSYAETSNSKDGVFCEPCRVYRAKGSWHCPSCNICIMKREQHCWVFDICVGSFNKRYYTLFLAYSTITSLFCGISTFILLIYSYGFIKIARNMFNMDPPLLSIDNPREFLKKTRYELEMDQKLRISVKQSYFLLGSVIFVLYPGFLTYLHVKNILKGLTVNEAKRGKRGEDDWKKNMEKVFGKRWRLALFWPFVHSPLPAFETNEVEDKVL